MAKRKASGAARKPGSAAKAKPGEKSISEMLWLWVLMVFSVFRPEKAKAAKRKRAKARRRARKGKAKKPVTGPARSPRRTYRRARP